MKTIIDPAKLKVVELRAELSARGLDTKGNKAVLIDRLRDALSQEEGDDSSAPQPEETEPTEEEVTQEDSKPQVIVQSTEVVEAPQQDTPEEVVEHGRTPKNDAPEEKSAELEAVDPEVQQEETSEVDMVATENEDVQEKEQEEVGNTEPMEIKQEVQIKEEPVESVEPVEIKQEEPTENMEVSVPAQVTDNAPIVKEEVVQEVKKETSEEKTAPSQPEVKTERRSTTRWSQVKEERNDTQVTKQIEQTPSRGQKRQRSPSPEERNKSFREPIPRKPDDEPEFDENAVILGWYDSDLNLVISKEKGFVAASPMHEEGFAYVWAGARASHGITSGKVYYETRITENCDISHLAEQEPNPNVLRVGWSTTENSMQLGEEPLSFGYGGTGKASTNCTFKDYGRSFDLGDVVTAYLDMDSNPVRISFSVNGSWQGYAYEVSKEKLAGKALFPHILSKNCAFECYFGSCPIVKQEDGAEKSGTAKEAEPWVGTDEQRADYVPIGRLQPHLRVPGPKRPEKRGDCEAIMMVGLPACGKTTWANEWAKKHPEKLYNIMGTNSLIDKMKIMGLPRKRNYHGRWDVLIDKCTKCLVRLLAVAANRRRNYIIDQTNVYPSAQRRKMKGFEGFIRRAVVIVPTDEEFKKRQAKQEKVEGKDVPESAVFEMKANFKVPEVGESFDEVIYVELGEQEAKQLVTQYNREAREAGYAPVAPPQKRFRGGGGGTPMPNRERRPMGRREPVRGGGAAAHQSGPAVLGSRGGRGDYRGRGGNWMPRGNWRDNRPSFQAGSGGGGGNYRNRGGGWRGGWGGGGGGNYRGGYDRNRAGGAGGGGRGQPSGGKGGWGGSWSGGGNNSGGNWGGQPYGHGWGGQQGWKGYSPPSDSGYGSQSNYSQDSYGSGGHYGSSDSVYSADGQGSYPQAYDGSTNQQGGYGAQGGGQSSGGYGSAGGYGSSASGGATGSYGGADSGYGAAGTDWNQQYYQGYGNGSQSWNQGYTYGNQASSLGNGIWQGSGSYGATGGAATGGATTGGYDYGAQVPAVGSGATGNGGYGK